MTRQDLRELFSIHWGIETPDRALKQLCNIGKFLVRTTEAIGTHFFCSLRAFCQLELMRFQEKIESWYEPQRDLYLRSSQRIDYRPFPTAITSNFISGFSCQCVTPVNSEN